MIRTKDHKSHKILIVEDEKEMAFELGEVLDAQNYEYVHVTNQKEAQEIILQGDICCVILDLQIFVSKDSCRPRIEAGQALLRFIREHYPNRIRNGVHGLPVLILSGHAKDHEYVVTAFQEGADDFILKPPRSSFGDKIRKSLARCGRADHSNCPTVTKQAAEPENMEPHFEDNHCVLEQVSIRVTSRQKRKRIGILVNETPVYLTPSAFSILLHLLYGRLNGNNGWVHRRDLGARVEQGWKGISRLNAQLRPYLPRELRISQNDGQGSYRLHPDIAHGGVDCDGLDAIDEHRIRTLSAQIKALL